VPRRSQKPKAERVASFSESFASLGPQPLLDGQTVRHHFHS